MRRREHTAPTAIVFASWVHKNRSARAEAAFAEETHMIYAHWTRRVGGNVVDSLIALPIFATAAWLLRPDEGDSTSALVLLGVVAIGLGVDGWNRWYLRGKTGQSLGGRVAGTRLVGEQSGTPIGPRRAFVRDLAHVVDSMTLWVGYLLPIWTAKRQTLADKIMSTVVVTH
jgi:uncharacterized RDD family membrane protein YckC